MKNSQQNPIDELFREEFSTYTVPVATASSTIVAAAAIKKGLLYKFSIFKLNIFYSAAIVSTTVGGVSLGIIETYQFIKAKENTTINTVSNNSFSPINSQSTLVIDSLDQSPEEIIEKQTLLQENKSNNEYTTSVIESKPDQSGQFNETKTDVGTTPDKKSEIATNTSNVEEPVQMEKPKADSVVPTPVVKKVVYVKPQQVVVQDTVVKVIKKSKK